MPRYLVIRAAVLRSRRVRPGQLLESPDNALLLIQRGFILPVPDNYPGDVVLGAAEDVPYRALQARARELGLPVKGSRDALASAVADAESRTSQGASGQTLPSSPSTEESALTLS